ncbi:MAG: hypothetical protein GY926_11515, partial [bacterium]|nr:hypothetical protein [bacterium]
EDTVRGELKPGEREDELLRVLDAEPFLLVLDGLERVLIAYARLDAARMVDDDLDDETMNLLFDAGGVPVEVREAHLVKHRLRLTADPRVGEFLRRLCRVRASRVLVTSRLFPADLQTPTTQPVPGSRAVFLGGLSDDDALGLWRAFGVSGSTGQLRSVFRSVDNYPLLVRALAGEVAGYRPAPGDFDAWLEGNPGFDPARLELRTARTHVLEHALAGLEDGPRAVLGSVAAFRMPATYETVRALHVGQGRVCGSDRDLDVVLTELEDRGLVGWDKEANRYDLHPIVRSVVWDRLQPGDRRRIHTDLHDYFDAIPKPPNWEAVESLDDLTGAIELYRSLLGLERYDDALTVFRDHLEDAMQYRLSASRERVELLEPLFPDGAGAPPQLQTPSDQSWALNALALAYDLSGEPGRAVAPYQLAVEIAEREDHQASAAVGWINLSDALRQAGRLRDAHHAALTGLALSRELDDQFGEAASLQWLGLVLAVSGVGPDSEVALQRSIRLFTEEDDLQMEGVGTAFLGERALWFGDLEQGRQYADRAWELAHHYRQEWDFVRAARLQGTAALALDDLDTANERLHHALTRARATNLVEEELPTL